MRRRFRSAGHAPRTATVMMLGLGASMAAADSGRGLTVRDFLRMQDVHRVMFTPDGREIIFERTPPHEEAPNLDATGERAAKPPITHVYVTDARGRGGERLLFDQAARGGYWTGHFSPSGARLSIYARIGQETRAGVFDRATRQVRWFDFTPRFDPSAQVWLSDDIALYSAPAVGSYLAEQGRWGVTEAIAQRWRKSFAGRESSATVLTSTRDGKYETERFRPGRLLAVNVATGTLREFAAGDYRHLTLSRDRRFLAALAQAGFMQPGLKDVGPTYGMFYMGGRHKLMIYDTQDGYRAFDPCPTCDVHPGSAHWLSSSKAVAFRAKAVDAPFRNASLYIYHVTEQRLETVATPGMEVACNTDFVTAGTIDIADLNGRPLVYGHARASDKPAEAGVFACVKAAAAAQSDWYLLNHGQAVNLTGELKDVSQHLIGNSASAAFVLANGQVWRIEATGKKRRLAKSTRRPLRLTAGGPGLQRAMLETSHEVVSLDLEREAVRVVAKPSASALLLASAPAGDRIVVKTTTQGLAERFSVQEATGSSHVLFDLNTHLTDIAPLREVKLSHRGPDGNTVMSCMTLPPDFVPGRRYPTIVETYPGIGCLGYRVVGYPTREVLLTTGYIVLNVSGRLGSRWVNAPDGEQPREWLAVQAATDQAVAEGYADPHRLGLLGESNGMDEALTIITHTDRFKAAVTSVGASDAIANYFMIMPECRQAECMPGGYEDFEGEISSNYIGPKPWEDPLAYIRNSPALHPDRINTPLLMTSGDIDGYGMTQADHMFSALYRLRKEVQHVTYWGEGHGNLSPANIRDRWARIFAWYDRWLDLARDPDGTLLWEGNQARSRHGSPAWTPEDFLRLKAFGGAE